jgi:5-formyltetrahydrofolate cyclo-ligase
MALQRALRRGGRQLLRLRGRRLAGYVAFDGEADPARLLLDAILAGRRVHLPVLERRPRIRLSFAPLRTRTRLGRNRYGIPEPVVPVRHRRRAQALDYLLVPLVGWDASGNRLGMGAGYYDRTVSMLRHRRRWLRPKLVGVAFELQRVDALPTAAWDVPLWGIVTECGFRRTP